MAPKKQIVIVGGGAGGTAVARSLSEKSDSSKFEITLISPSPLYVYLVATPRMIVTDEGKLEDSALITLDKLFVNGNGRVKQGKVASILPNKGDGGGSVALETGESVPYDVLVLATGNRWSPSYVHFPTGREKAVEYVAGYREKIKAAKSIAIAGGGAVGVEVAGEISHYYPEKHVTIVHSGKALLNDAYPAKFRKDVARRLTKRNVELILGDKIENAESTTTTNGISLEVDFIIIATGSAPNNEWIGSSLGADVLAKSGYVNVKPTLQVNGYNNIFALGDMIEWKEQKQIGKIAYGHLPIVVANVGDVANGATPKKVYKGSMEMIFISIGRGGAGFVNALWGLMFGDWVVGSVKSKGLFVPATRKALGHAS
ncbi:FAD/NAD-binding domain-containing protein [Hysterangium stoloniferum]|nr:FAD/NAD-binding domain-containing protein [Hysterangium stoloniferum]